MNRKKVYLGMWTCPGCGRIFERKEQAHSCRLVSLEEHFKNKEKAKKLFDFLVETVDAKIGKSRIISIPCCVHLFGKYDFLAVLPKKNGLEVRFALNRKLDSIRLKQAVAMSAKVIKNCVDISSLEGIDQEFVKWLDEAYHLKD